MYCPFNCLAGLPLHFPPRLDWARASGAFCAGSWVPPVKVTQRYSLDNNGPSLSLITGKTLFRMRKTVGKSIKLNSPVLLFWDATKSSEISLKFFLLIFRKLRTICWTWSLTFMTVTLRQSRCLTRCYPPCPCPRYPHWGRHPPPPLPPPPAPP